MCHLRPVEQERKNVKFAALDHEVARVLGPQRGPSLIYAFLASSWYEFAGADKLAEIKKKTGRTITPGDWIEASYEQFMGITGSRAFASIVRWLRALSEQTYSCPWGRCADNHPLIIVKRQGQSRPNRYRRWKCGEDVLIQRARITSTRLSDAARRRVLSGHQLNSSEPDRTERPGAETGTQQIEIPIQQVRTSTSTEGGIPVSDISPQEFKSSHDKSPRSLVLEVQDISMQEIKNSRHESSPREKTDFVGPKGENTTTNGTAAARLEESDEIDAVACEIAGSIAELARRIDPTYSEERAWSVARRLAGAVLETTQDEAAAARALLQRAISDRRLARATNPIGLLIRGVIGDVYGQDRYLLAGADHHEPKPPTIFATVAASQNARRETRSGLAPGLEEALLEALRRGQRPDSSWLRERDISPEALAVAEEDIVPMTAPPSDTPLADRLAAADPTRYTAELERILRELPLPARLGIEPRLDHPMLLGMCRAKLELNLQVKAASTAPPTL